MSRLRRRFLYEGGIFVAVAYLAVLLAIPQRAFAWGPEGHQIIVIVAEHYMRPETAARVQKAQGVPIATHDGSGAREQFNWLIQNGATPRRVFISHVDMGLHGKQTREQVSEELISIAKDGGYMEFDTFGQESYTPWRDLVFLWRSICDAGFANRMLISMDCNWHWENGKKIFEGADKPNADPDASRRTYAYMMTDAVPKLLKSGFSQKEIHTFLVDNPRRYFCGE
jgi:phosphotriesterase-related protein